MSIHLGFNKQKPLCISISWVHQVGAPGKFEVMGHCEAGHSGPVKQGPWPLATLKQGPFQIGMIWRAMHTSISLQPNPHSLADT